jgi:probable HAF family extracellular repeat protein
MRRPSSSFALSLCLTVLTIPAASAQKYTVTDLGTLPGSTTPFPSSIGNGVNNLGQVTGSATAAGPCTQDCSHAFLYSDNKMRDLGTLPGGNVSVGNGINSRDRPWGDTPQEVGYSEVSGGTFHAFLWDNEDMQDLGTFPGGSASAANAISPSGEVTGNADIANGNFHAFLYSHGTMHDLGTLPGGTFSQGASINRIARPGSAGRHVIQVVGSGDVPGDCSSHLQCPYHAFLYSNGAMRDLGTLPGGFFSNATGVNRSGQITGSADTPQGDFHAFLYEMGKMHDLGTLPNGFQSFARGINRRGTIVGYGSVGSVSDYHAIVYRHGKMQDLNSLIPANAGWFLGFAYAINDRGQITGSGIINGEGHAFLLTPVCSGDNDHDRDDRDKDRCGDDEPPEN